MKKKIIILLSVVIILLMGIVVWFNIPLDLMDLDPNEVMEIVVFNGNSGNATHITDKEQIHGGGLRSISGIFREISSRLPQSDEAKGSP